MQCVCVCVSIKFQLVAIPIPFNSGCGAFWCRHGIYASGSVPVGRVSLENKDLRRICKVFQPSFDEKTTHSSFSVGHTPMRTWRCQWLVSPFVVSLCGFMHLTHCCSHGQTIWYGRKTRAHRIVYTTPGNCNHSFTASHCRAPNAHSGTFKH